jgi:hypothetical protein
MFIRQAVESLAHDNNVLYFDNRLRFLVCASVVKNATILIDTLEPDGHDVRWLYAKLAGRGLARKINYFAPQLSSENRYLKGFSLITNIMKLKKVCPLNKRRHIPDYELNPESIVEYHLKSRLNESELTFLKSFYESDTEELKRRTKKDAARLYYIRCKLHLGSSSELKQLMLFLSESESLRSHEREGMIDNLNKKALWSITRTQALL